MLSVHTKLLGVMRFRVIRFTYVNLHEVSPSSYPLRPSGKRNQGTGTIRTPPASLGEAFPSYQVPHSGLRLLIPQAVDDGVEQGGHHSIEEGGELVCKVLFVCLPGGPWI